MLIIRKEQMDVLDAKLGGETEFIERMILYLREAQPERTEQTDDVTLRDSIAAAMNRARNNGVHSELALATWIEIDLVHGPGFESKKAWAKEILEKGGPERKVDQGNALVAELYHVAANITPGFPEDPHA